MCVHVRSRYIKRIAVCALSKHFNAVAALDWKSMLEQIDLWWIFIANNQKKTDH